jgi:hypothetical protein
MASAREYFETDFSGAVVANNTFRLEDVPTRQVIPVAARLHNDFDANARFLVLYVPHLPDAAFLRGIGAHVDRMLARLSEGPTFTVGRDGELPAHDRDLQFTGRVFVYAEADLPDEVVQQTGEVYRAHGLYLRFRGTRYAAARVAQERPLGFISYDSSDRDTVAQPLARELAAIHCPTWFDDFAMRAGDRLEPTLLKGIDECVRCIVILSPAYLANNRWARWEFDRIAEREAREQLSRIIPIRYGVTDPQIAEFSPMLAHRRSIEWNASRVAAIASELSITLLSIGREREWQQLFNSRPPQSS